MSSVASAVPRRNWSGSWLNQALQNRLIALVLVMVVIVPLLATPADRAFTGIAALTFETGAIIMLALMLWRNRMDVRRESVVGFLKTGVNAPVLLLLSLATISCALSPHKLFSVQEWLKLSSGVVLYFVVAYQFRQSKHLSMLADVLVFLSLAISLASLAQYQFLSAERLTTLFGNAQPLASLVMLLLPIVAVLAFSDKNPKRQVIAQITAVLMIGCLFLTHGRSAWLGGAAGLFTLGVLALRLPSRREKPTLSLAARKHQVVLPLMLIAVSIGFFFVMNSQNQDMTHRASSLTHLTTDDSWQERVQNYWQGSVTMIKQRPLTGWGVGLYPLYQHDYTARGADYTDSDSSIMGNQRLSLAEQAHNFYLQLAAELGLPGLLVMAAVLVGFLAAGMKRIDGMDQGIRHSLLVGSMAAIVAFMVDAVGSPSWQYGQVSMFLWLMLGIGSGCMRPRTKAEPQVEDLHLGIVPRRWTRMSATAVCLLMMTFLPTALVSAQTGNYNGDCNTNCRTQFNSCTATCRGKTGQERARCQRDCAEQQRLCREGCRTDNNDRSFLDIAYGGAALAAVGYVIYNAILGTSIGGAGAGSGIIVAGDDDDDNKQTPVVPAPAR